MGPTVERMKAYDWKEWLANTGIDAAGASIALVVFGASIFTLEVWSAIGYAAMSTIGVAVTKLLGNLRGHG